MLTWLTLVPITFVTYQIASDVSVELVGKMHRADGWNVGRIVPVDNSRSLIVNVSRLEVISFSKPAQPALISSLENDWIFWRGSLAYCPLTRALAHADSTDNTAIYFYSVKADGQLVKTKTIAFGAEYKKGPTLALAYSPNGSLFAYANQKQKPIILLETKGYKEVSAIPFKASVEMLEFLNDKLLLAVGFEGQATIWDISSQKLTIAKEFHVPFGPTLAGAVMDMRFDRIAKVITLVYYTPTGLLGLTEVSYGDGISVRHRTVELGKWAWFGRCKLSPNKKYLLTGDINANLRVLDITTANAKMMLERKLEGARVIRSIEYLDESHVAVGCLGEWLYVFKIREP